ncbi:hypothetical protein [Serratia ficaria]|uniref:hypothetical protein n=1 Tax=Serratia ficaria TaxID=61651 RepID=UPI00077C422E|nr:hypothetical protein [Serratia ficaria]CAI1174885.1 Uncharacterised protein [Serratia ficaria]CAI1905753.1 Uncharacterised protein [Serratia ficaria]CAI1948765.1 Uncharacterised protein [Serratia ficaria]VVA50310.1 hypothetical protein SERVES_04076 [Serratia ficaria]
MDSAFSLWLWRWLSLPGWQVLATQWLALSLLALVAAGWLLRDEGQQRERASAQRQRLEQQIEQRERQLAQMPTQEAMRVRLRQAIHPSVGQAGLTEALRPTDATLLRWQRLEKPPRQLLSVRIGYAGLLTLLTALPAGLRIERLSIETPPQGMRVRLTLQDDAEGYADE